MRFKALNRLVIIFSLLIFSIPRSTKSSNDYLSIIQEIEILDPSKITESEIYKQIQSSKTLAKKLLKDELKNNLYAINAAIMLKAGNSTGSIESIIRSKEFEFAIEKSLSSIEIEKRLDNVIALAISEEFLIKTFADMQKSIIEERAFYVENKLRDMNRDNDIGKLVYKKLENQSILEKLIKKFKKAI